MNFSLDSIPKRPKKPRESGLTMVMDKGLSVRQAEDLVESSGEWIDLLKLGFGSAYVTPNLEKKIAVYRSAGLPVYFGGTLLEAFIIRNQFDDYRKLLDKFKMTHGNWSVLSGFAALGCCLFPLFITPTLLERNVFLKLLS